MNRHPDDSIDARLDGELPDADWFLLQAHLLTCDRCRARLAEGQAIRRLLAEAEPPPIATSTPAFWASLAPRLEPRRTAIGWGWVWGGAMLAAMIMGHAIALAAFVAALLERSGVPVSRWLAPTYPRVGGFGGGLEHGAGEAWALLRGFVGWGRFLTDDAVVLLALNVALLVAAAGLALAFLGWVAAQRRRRLVHVVLSA